MRIPALMIVMFLQCAADAKKKVSKVTVENTRSSSEIDQLRQIVADLSKQVMMQQLHVEEKARSEGYSGIKLVRGINKGLKNYASDTHLAPAVFSIHDHSNYDRTIGIGEFSAVLNGVDFRTRHNDFTLVMPSRTSKEYHTYEDIPFPEVPPEVLKQRTVQDQVLEMIEWFKAFNNQDKSRRDYTKYFKPVMCYLEGAWTLDKDIEEPFPSDRHMLEAKSWVELHEQNRFATYTGTKHRLENVAYLPTAIVSVNNVTGEAVYAQWNYRIACHPIGYDIPLHFFHQENDLSFRVPKGQTMGRTDQTRAARFKLFDPSRKTNFQILDSIFAEIPGKDNYGSNLTITAFADVMYDIAFTDKTHLLNMGYYHRSYKTLKSGAGGITYTALGFNDENLFVALTTQPRVAPLETDQCYKIYNKYNKLATRCERDVVRVSYAVPLEVIFLTPLLTWNPYNIVFHDDTDTATKDGHTGGTLDKALNGIDKTHYYKTPKEFFSGPLDLSDPADTVRNFMYVQSPDGKAKQVSSSGTRIMLQNIGGKDRIRLRYPIAPVYYEGSSVWKELNALKDNADENVPSSIVFEMSVTVQDPPGEHTHEFSISLEEFSLLQAGETIHVVTEEAQEHTHELTIKFDEANKSFRYTSCNGDVICWDGHPPPVILETKNGFTELK